MSTLPPLRVKSILNQWDPENQINIQSLHPIGIKSASTFVQNSDVYILQECDMLFEHETQMRAFV